MSKRLTPEFILSEVGKAEPAMRNHSGYVRDFSNGLQVVVQLHVEGPYCRVWVACCPRDKGIFDSFLAQAQGAYLIEYDGEDDVPSAFIGLKA
jgi:hypothetical protein